MISNGEGSHAGSTMAAGSSAAATDGVPHHVDPAAGIILPAPPISRSSNREGPRSTFVMPKGEVPNPLSTPHPRGSSTPSRNKRKVKVSDNTQTKDDLDVTVQGVGVKSSWERVSSVGTEQGVMYPLMDELGVEGAAAAFAAYHHKHKGTRYASKGEDNEDGSDMDGEEGVLARAAVPLNVVLAEVAHQRRRAELCGSLKWYLVFVVLFLAFLTLTFSSTIERANGVSEDALTKRLESNWAAYTKTTEEAVLSAFQAAAETYTTEQDAKSASTFLPGGSARFPWMYPYYNETVNAWTPQPHPSATVDAQVRQVAKHLKTTNMMQLSAIRTKRDVIGWIVNSYIPSHWDCVNVGCARGWRDLQGGSHLSIGSARITARRRREVDFVLKKGERVDEDEDNELESRISSHSAICGKQNPAIPSEMLFTYSESAGGYIAHLPFTAPCSEIGYIVSQMSGDAPQDDGESLDGLRVSRNDARAKWWMSHGDTYPYAGDYWYSRAIDTHNANSCRSFFLHSTVTDLVLEYVVYATAINRYYYTVVIFAFEGLGSVVVPRVKVYSAPSISWEHSPAALAMSIALGLYILVYTHHLLAPYIGSRLLESHNNKEDSASVMGWLWRLLRDITHLDTLPRLCALVLTSAVLSMYWWLWAHTTNLGSVAYTPISTQSWSDHMGTTSRSSGSVAYPEHIAFVCRSIFPLWHRFVCAATICTFAALLRFTAFIHSIGVALTIMRAALKPLLIAVVMWWLMNVGAALMCVMVYSYRVTEFSTFARAYGTLLMWFITRGVPSTSTFGFSGGALIYDASLPSARGSRIAVEEVRGHHPTLLARMFMVNPIITPVFSLCYICVNVLLFTALVVAIVVQARLYLNSRQCNARYTASMALWDDLPGLCFTRKYVMECMRRVMWSRREAVLLGEIQEHLHRFKEASPVSAAGILDVGTLHYRQDGSFSAEVQQVTYRTLLWMLPRTLQAEYGPAHLKQLWRSCMYAGASREGSHAPPVPSTVTASDNSSATYVRRSKTASVEAWLAPLDKEAVVLGEKLRTLNVLLEELPSKIVKYLESDAPHSAVQPVTPPAFVRK